MTPKAKETLLRLIGNARGDDLQRARLAFRSLSPAQMQEQHGQSGQTRQQILDSYETHNREMDELAKEVERA
jgi:hypothetical protein